MAAAAQVYADIGGLKGFVEHRLQDLERAKQWLVDHGVTLEAISSLLGNISTLLSLVALIPGPWSPIFAAIGLAAGLLKLLVDLPRAMSGEMSWGRYLFGAALTLLPFAAKGVGALAMKGGVAASRAARTAQVASSNSWLANVRLLSRAEQFQKSLAFTQKLDKLGKFFHIGQRGLAGHHFILSENRLVGAAAERSAGAVVDLAKSGSAYETIKTVEKGLGYASKAEKVYHYGEKGLDYVQSKLQGGDRRGH